MRKIILTSTAILGAMLALSLHPAPAQAQMAARTWVSGTGTGSAPCARTAPCPNFQIAHDATTPGGEINCVDAGSYAPLTINRSISIVCDNTEAAILVPPGVIAIQIAAGANDIVTLKGLDLNGLGDGFKGIDFISGAALHVHKVHIRNFRFDGIGDAGGLYFEPNTYAELYVADSTITDNGPVGGAPGFSGGIVITPGGSGSVNALISRVRLENNVDGILVDGFRSMGVAVNATVLDSVIAGSTHDGLHVRSAPGQAAASAFFDHSVASGNFGSGVRAVGPATSGAGSATVRIGDSTIVLNATGVSTGLAGVVQSFKNNRISGNLNDGTPIPAVPGPGGTPLQ